MVFPIHWRELLAVVVAGYLLAIAVVWIVYRRGERSRESRINAIFMVLVAPLSLVVMGVMSLGLFLWYLAATAD